MRAARGLPACWQPAPPAARSIAPFWPRGRPAPRWTPAPAAAAEIFAACPARFNWLYACVPERCVCRPAPCDSAANDGGRGAVHHCGACSQCSALEAVLGGGIEAWITAAPALRWWQCTERRASDSSLWSLLCTRGIGEALRLGLVW